MKQNSNPLCINCKHNRVTKCGLETDDKKTAYPKAYHCADYGYVPAYVFKSENLYAKFHTTPN